MGSNRAWRSRDTNRASIIHGLSMHNRIKQLQHRHSRGIQGNLMRFKVRDIHSASDLIILIGLDGWRSRNIVAEQTLNLAPLSVTVCALLLTVICRAMYNAVSCQPL